MYNNLRILYDVWDTENTFLLSLDGDVDFRPDAVRLLVDRMKKNKKVGAACGRIHPIGSGRHGSVSKIRIRYWSLVTESCRTRSRLCDNN